MTEAVLFDVDGTLIDSNYWHVMAWQQAFVRIGHPQTGWQVHAAIGMGGDRLIAAVAATMWKPNTATAPGRHGKTATTR